MHHSEPSCNIQNLVYKARMIPKTLAEAKEQGSPRYFTGKPCIHGHVAQRSTKLRTCLECRKDILRRYETKHKGRRKSSSSLRRANHKHSWGFAAHFWTENAEYYRWAANIAILSGLDLEVDHIIPLNHPEVCGLHFPGNFKLISSDANRKKSNKLSDEARNPPPIKVLSVVSTLPRVPSSEQ